MESWQPPEWMFRKKLPPNDDAYFENMCRVIFQAGLNWNVVGKKWPNFRKTFDNFSIDNMARFDNFDIEHLITSCSAIWVPFPLHANAFISLFP
jgi:3-methyladenine DNA glycosylase Tag